MWSRRTSTRKNFRAQISQVYFLSPWVNRCLFMLLLQENTCAHEYHRWRTSELPAAIDLYCCAEGSLFHRWDRETAPSCTWFLLLRWPQAPPSSCAFVLHGSIIVSLSKELVRHEMLCIWRIPSSLMSFFTEIHFETSQTPYKHWVSITQSAGFPAAQQKCSSLLLCDSPTPCLLWCSCITSLR